MSDFSALEKVREALFKCQLRFDWKRWFESPLRVATMCDESSISLNGVRLRMMRALEAMQHTGGRPSVAKLIEVVTSQQIGRQIRAFVARLTGEHLATCLLNANWEHTMVLELVQAARAYQLAICPLAQADDDSLGLHAELALFIENWLLSFS